MWCGGGNGTLHLDLSVMYLHGVTAASSDMVPVIVLHCWTSLSIYVQSAIHTNHRPIRLSYFRHSFITFAFI